MGRDPPTAEHGDLTKFPPVRPIPQGRKQDRWDGSPGGEELLTAAKDGGRGGEACDLGGLPLLSHPESVSASAVQVGRKHPEKCSHSNTGLGGEEMPKML